jgi:hypothetical protein
MCVMHDMHDMMYIPILTLHAPPDSSPMHVFLARQSDTTFSIHTINPLGGLSCLPPFIHILKMSIGEI